MFLFKCQDNSIIFYNILLQLVYKSNNRKVRESIMPMNREEHETLLAELLTPDLDASRRTEILQNIRDNYTEFTTSTEVLVKDKEKLEKDNSALVVANSKLFRSHGIVVDDEPKKDDKKEFSQTVTIEQLEQKLKK